MSDTTELEQRCRESSKYWHYAQDEATSALLLQAADALAAQRIIAENRLQTFIAVSGDLTKVTERFVSAEATMQRVAREMVSTISSLDDAAATAFWEERHGEWARMLGGGHE